MKNTYRYCNLSHNSPSIFPSWHDNLVNRGTKEVSFFKLLFVFKITDLVTGALVLLFDTDGGDKLCVVSELLRFLETRHNNTDSLFATIILQIKSFDYGTCM